MSSGRYSGTNVRAYMMMMALFDCLVLLFTIPPEWFESVGLFTFKELSPVTCRVEKFIQYTAGDASVWILCAFTVDRALAVASPLMRRHRCLPRHAWITCFALSALAVAKNTHVFWTRGAEFTARNSTNGTVVMKLVKNCGQPPPFDNYEQYLRPWIAFSLLSVLPFCIIASSNVVIILTLMKSRRLQKRAGGGKQDTNFRQTTIMCLSVSAAFLVTVTPTIILLIGKPYWRGRTAKPSAKTAYDIAKAINNQLFCVNHSINFWLYCITGEAFRDELRRVLNIAPRRTSAETTAIANAALNLHRVISYEASKKSCVTMRTLSTVTGSDGEVEPLCYQPSVVSRQDSNWQTTNIEDEDCEGRGHHAHLLTRD